MINDYKIIDFHSHILPCADHGSDGIKTSKNQVALMNNAGVDTAVLTPHFHPDRHRVEDLLAIVSSSADELIRACDERPHFCIGAEVLYCDGIENMEGLDSLCIRGTNALLLELPMRLKWEKAILYEVKRIAARHTVILAHIDRYMPFHQADFIALLSSDNIYAQINASSLFNEGDRSAIMQFIDADCVCGIGSDLHDASKKQYRFFEKAEKKLGESYGRIMKNSEKILKDAILF